MRRFLFGMLAGMFLLAGVWAWKSYSAYEVAYKHDVNRLCKHWTI